MDRRHTCIVLGFFFASLFGGSAVAMAQAQERIEQLSSRSVEETVERIVWATGSYGITVVNAFDYRAILKKIKRETPPSVVVELLRREWTEAIVNLAPSAALELPLRVHVYQRADGATVVSYRRPSAALSACGNTELSEFGLTLDAKLAAVVQTATR
jgi:uncharacterized protein (DUF302 family)